MILPWHNGLVTAIFQEGLSAITGKTPANTLEAGKARTALW